MENPVKNMISDRMKDIYRLSLAFLGIYNDMVVSHLWGFHSSGMVYNGKIIVSGHE